MFRHMARSVTGRPGGTGFLILSAESRAGVDSRRSAGRTIAPQRPERRGCMRCTKRVRLTSAVLLAGASIGVYAALTTATASAGAGHAVRTHTAKTGPSVKRFNLKGYVIDTDYSLGRNTGNTFRQTYKGSTVHGVPFKGPFVGTKFPVEDYVAMPIGNHELYVA